MQSDALKEPDASGFFAGWCFLFADFLWVVVCVDWRFCGLVLFVC